MGGTSRMSREAHVRSCEGLGVKFPGATRRMMTMRTTDKPFKITKKQVYEGRGGERYGKGVAKTTSCVDLRTWTAMSKEKTQVAKPRGRKYRCAGQGGLLRSSGEVG